MHGVRHGSHSWTLFPPTYLPAPPLSPPAALFPSLGPLAALVLAATTIALALAVLLLQQHSREGK